MLSRSLFLVLALAFSSCFLTPLVFAQGGASGVSEGYDAFWYELDDSDNAVRERISGIEYENRKTQEIHGRWIPIYTDYLQGDYEAHLDEFDMEKAERMIALDALTARRIQENPLYLEETARQMAEWAFFYEQLEYWNKFVEEQILRVDLAEEEKITFNPSTIRTDLPAVYDALKTRADEISQEQFTRYRRIISKVEKNNLDQEVYEAWLKDRQDSMFAFAEKWSRQFDGSEFWIGDVLYLVRNYSDRPADPEDDITKETLPRHAVLLEVPKERIVTPFDLINEDGSIKAPDSR